MAIARSTISAAGRPRPAGPARRLAGAVADRIDRRRSTATRSWAPRTGAPTPPTCDVTRVRGTKNPDVAAHRRAAPRPRAGQQGGEPAPDVERLRAAGVPVWVTDIETVDRGARLAAPAVRRGAGWAVPAWLADGRDACGRRRRARHRARRGDPDLARPWMVVGARHVHRRPGRPARAGATSSPTPTDRYPHVTSTRSARRRAGPGRAARRALRLHRAGRPGGLPDVPTAARRAGGC